MGVSRFTLTWTGVPSAAGYFIHEATETALLSTADLLAPDTTLVHHKRLKTLRDSVDIGSKRLVFRRITSQPVTGTAHEVALPRGSKVMHFHAVTTVTENHIEGAFPADNRSFFAVAAPRLAEPPRLWLSAAPAMGDPQHVAVHLELADGASGQIELYRTTVASAADDAGSMGPPLGLMHGEGAKDFTDSIVKPGWRPQRYRAIVWAARDDILGLVEARSAPTPQVTVVVPPPPPVISGLAGDQPPSSATDCLMVWAVPAAPPPGTRCIVEVRSLPDLTQPPLQRFPDRPGDATQLGSLADLPMPAAGRHDLCL